MKPLRIAKQVLRGVVLLPIYIVVTAAASIMVLGSVAALIVLSTEVER